MAERRIGIPTNYVMSYSEGDVTVKELASICLFGGQGCRISD